MSYIADEAFEEFFSKIGVEVEGRTAHEYRQRHVLGALGALRHPGWRR